VGRPHGTSGEVYVVEISDDPARFAPGATLLTADGGELEVENARRHRNRFLVKFVGVDGRDAAEALRGPLFVSADAVRELEPDEFWLHQIEGAMVVLSDGREVGVVRAVIPGSAQDLLQVETARGERLVPVVKEIVRSVDVAARRVEIDPPEGLLD
jgi:16S rRNA processing protein RimM